MVIFSLVKDINIAIGRSSKILCQRPENNLNVSLKIAPENGKSVNFIQLKYIDRINMYLDENTLGTPFVSNGSYLFKNYTQINT